MSDWAARESLAELVAILGGDAVTRAVGGAVRDRLLALPVSDIDLATALTPEDVVDALARAGVRSVPTGLTHGTVTALTADGPVEVTTLRRDVETDGRHARVAFTDDWKADAARRDFTINALYLSLGDGQVHDYFNGLADLHARRVRFIGDPLQRIAEDHLRILRFFRFHARFAVGSPDPAGLAACSARAADLMALSRERVASELLKLLAVADPVPTVRAMLDHAVLAQVIPEFDDASLHRLAALVAAEAQAGELPHPIRRLAALVGLRPTLARDLPGRLRLSNGLAKRLVAACQPLVAAPPQALAHRLGTETAVDQLLLASDVEGARAAARFAPRRLPLTGADLLARGVPPGPEIGRVLRLVEERWMEAGFPEGDAFAALLDQTLAR